MGELVTIFVQAPAPSATAVEVPYQTIIAQPEQYFQAADIVWVMVASAMVFLMVPALSLIFAALSNRSFAMTMFRLPLMTAAVVGLQWVFWGYSLTFTDGTLVRRRNEGERTCRYDCPSDYRWDGGRASYPRITIRFVRGHVCLVHVRSCPCPLH